MRIIYDWKHDEIIRTEDFIDLNLVIRYHLGSTIANVRNSHKPFIYFFDFQCISFLKVPCVVLNDAQPK